MCSDDNPCQEGLECTLMPDGFDRCAPIKCALEAMSIYIQQTDFDFENYPRHQDEMLRRFPGEQNSTSTTQEISHTIRDNPPLNLTLFVEAFEECSDNSALSGTRLTPYFGAHWANEGDLVWGQGVQDPLGVGLLNKCYGMGTNNNNDNAGGVGALIGLAFADTLEQGGCKQMFPIPADIPHCCGLRIGYQGCHDPTLLIEFTAGDSATAGLPGYTSCTTTNLVVGVGESSLALVQ